MVAAIALPCLLLTASATARTTALPCPPAPAPATQSAPAATGAQPSTPEQIVACVGSMAITGATFSHWADVADHAGGPSAKHDSPASGEVVKEVMGFLISSDWVIGEARDRGISISEAQVRYAFDRVRAQQFPRRSEFTAFLKRSGQTVADLLLRVRLNILSERLQGKVLAGHRGKRDDRLALERFIHAFKAKWTAQTYCEPSVAVADCGRVQANL